MQLVIMQEVEVLLDGQAVEIEVIVIQPFVLKLEMEVKVEQILMVVLLLRDSAAAEAAADIKAVMVAEKVQPELVLLEEEEVLDILEA
jgi:flagellar assembly factor FliW